MTLNTEKLTKFAQAVGTDIKDIKTQLANKAEKSEVGQGGITQEQLNTAIQGVKTAILGEGVPEELDTLKEIADKIKAGENPDSAIVSKMTELGEKFTTLENTDFVQIYNSAKNTL
ncbi:hypothetical protein [Streptococcus sp. AM43-2AT]|uniref:hypothetical protein n=1 Tax=Streptococcus sp. AM43-2AT TaxID=2293247 RepID=UPI000ED722AA|nr:hypothetical protein [Streptococcus sp. AM43-2AT]RJU23403.1 hypothetical protein DW930_08960 [Streptococcus sp. AM43-2AT]